METTLNWLYLIGLLLVIIFAVDRFGMAGNNDNTPKWNKYSTTASKYYSGLLLYIVTYVGFYHVLMIPDISGLVAGWDDSLQNLPRELISAMALTVLLPSIKGIKEYDVFIKNKIYDLVNIPREVQYMASRLANAEVIINDESMTKVIDVMVARGADEKKLKSLLSDEMVASYIKAEYLLQNMHECLMKREYKDFYQRYESDLNHLRSELNDIHLLIEAYINGSVEGIRRDKTILKKMNKDIGQLLNNIYKLISMAVISRLASDSGRMRRLAEIGFVLQDEDTRFNWDMVAMIFMGIIILYVLKYYVFESSDGSFKLLLSVQIAFGYCCAVFWAAYPKQRWNFARKRGEFRNYSFYLMAAVLTWASYSIVRILFAMGRGSGFEEYVSGRFLETTAYQIPSAVAAILLCYLMETSAQKGNRIVDALIGAVSMAGMNLLVSHMLDKQSDWYDLAISAMVGLLIFHTVPHWFRRAGEQQSVALPLQAQPA